MYFINNVKYKLKIIVLKILHFIIETKIFLNFKFVYFFKVFLYFKMLF